MPQIKNLKETSSLMNSTDHKDRLIAEYWQVKIRSEKLETILTNWNNLKFQPSCPKSILQQQLKVMQEYLQVLESRAVYEDIDLGIEEVKKIEAEYYNKEK